MHLLAVAQTVTTSAPHIDASTVTAILAGVVIPFVVDAITKSKASQAIKSWSAAVLSALAGVLPTVVFDPNTGWKAYVYNVLLAMVAAHVIHRTGVTDVVQRKTAHFGIGGTGPASTRPTGGRPPTAPTKTSPSSGHTTASKATTKRMPSHRRT